jgi:hypothetical protein
VAVLSRGRIQQQCRSSKISFSLNRLVDRVVYLVVRKLAELPKFLVFNSETNSFGNSSIFAFYLLLPAYYRLLYLLFELWLWC